MARKDHHRNIEFAGQVAAVKWTGAAEDNEREITRIESPTDRNKFGGVRHVRVGHTHNSVRRLSLLQTQRSANRFSDRVGCTLTIEHEPPVKQPLSKPPQQQVRVRVGGRCASLAVASWPGIGAGTLRSVAQRSARIQPRDRAAAGANSYDLDRRKHDWMAVLDRPCWLHPQLPPVHQRNIGAGAPHIEADCVRKTAFAGDVGTGDRTCYDAGRRNSGRVAARPLCSEYPTAGMQDQKVTGVALGLQGCSEGTDVACNDWPGNGVDCGSGKARMFEKFGGNFRGC